MGDTHRINNVAHNHIEVYVTADKFLTDSLKNFAFTNSAHLADSHWDSAVFPEIVHETIMSEPPHESILRDIVVGVTSKNILSLVQQRETLKLVDDLNLGGTSRA
jgi:hypothetical protein